MGFKWDIVHSFMEYDGIQCDKLMLLIPVMGHNGIYNGIFLGNIIV